MSLSLQITVPDGIVLLTQVVQVQAVDTTGQFTILAGHQAMLAVLVPSVLTYVEVNGPTGYVAVDGGVLIFQRDAVSVATRDAALSDRYYEVADQAAAMLATRRSEEMAAREAFAELESSLMKYLPDVG